MKLIVMALTMALAAAPAWAASPFDGTWVADTKSAQLPQKPETIQVVKGVYTCTFCKPTVTVPADGKFHKVTGHDYFDEVAVKVVDAKSISETDRMGGKEIYTGITSVSADGKTLTNSFTDTSASNGVPVKGVATFTRVGPVPAGGHVISGLWKQTAYKADGDEGLTVTWKNDGDMLSMSTPIGQSYTAKFGGPAVPVKGDPGNTMVAVKKTGAASFVETSTRKGKVVAVMTVSVAGTTASVAYDDKKAGTTLKYKMMRK